MFRPASKGATLIDTVVSTALMLVVFVGITAAFRFSVEVVTNNKARAGAIALANERMEYIRSLPYDQVGTVGGVPSGSLEQSETVTLNGMPYTRRTLVVYADDPKDGLGIADANDIVTDYKVVKTDVSWEARSGERTITLASRVSPLGIEAAVPGGTLALSVLDALAQPIENALVTIVNTTVNPTVNVSLFSDADGAVNLLGAPPGSGYEITVTRNGYSTARTYGATAQNTNPAPGHLTSADGETTSATFSIDVLGQKTIRTFLPIEDGLWSDTFGDETKVAWVTDVEIDAGVAELAGGAGSYPSAGQLMSTPIAPSLLAEWDSFSWDDDLQPLTGIVYRIYNEAGTDPIPDAVLPGNSIGFTISPVDLSGVPTTTYTGIRVSALFSSEDTNVTPSLNSWNVDFKYGPQPFYDVPFAMRGTKTIGFGPSGSVYKYDNPSLSSGPSASVTIQNLEWDSGYTVTVDGATFGYDISSSCEPQPETLDPGEGEVTELYFSPHTAHSFLVDVRSSDGTLIPGATVRLYRGAYDQTFSADFCGQSFFSGLSAGAPGTGNPYSIDVSAVGFQPFTANDVGVSGTSRLSVVLNPS